MNCKEFNNRLTEYLSEDVLPDDMQQHMKRCADCSEEYIQYMQIILNLTPKVKAKSQPGIKNSIINQLKERKKMNNKSYKYKTLKRAIGIAAVIIVLISVVPLTIPSAGRIFNTAKAAEAVFTKTWEALQKVNTLLIKVKIRTKEGDNFEYIGSEFDFVEHTIIKDFSGEGKWKIEKPMRVVSCDGQHQYLFIKNSQIAIKGQKNAGYVLWLKRLLDPQKLFEIEVDNTKNCKSCNYDIDKSGSDIVLTITSKARGDFHNPYSKNSSITESDNKIIYTFSKIDNLLRGLQVYIYENNKEVLVLDIEEIQYNPPLSDNDFIIKLPKGVEWKILDEDIYNHTFANITSKEAATRFFNACRIRDWESINDVWPLLSMASEKKSKEIKKWFGGITIISIGKPFKSGVYPGEYVPYEIKFKNGHVKKMNLALRNDNPNKIWMIDGGI